MNVFRFYGNYKLYFSNHVVNTVITKISTLRFRWLGIETHLILL